VADARLRIKGRFVTKEQAYGILGTAVTDLTKDENLKKFFENN
jgi:hypothetical protein